MRVVFFGTPDVAVSSLHAVLASSHHVVGVVTQPDRARGRGRSITPSPVKGVATEHELPVLQPASPKEDGFVDRLRSLEPDVFAVVAYGHILPPLVLAVAPAMNVHFSLLPRYRGAAPVQRALMDGVTETGVSIFLLEPTVDTGPILARATIPVGPEETAADVFARLAPLGAEMLVRALDDLSAGALAPQPQDDSTASPAPKITAQEAVIDWTRSAREVANLVRALNPRPGAFTSFRGKRMTVWRAVPAQGEGGPGTVLAAPDERFLVAAGSGALSLEEVQPEGKRAMAGAAFARGYRPQPGEQLGGP